MGWIRNLFKRKRIKNIEEYDEQTSWEDVVLRRDQIDINDAEQRERYVRSCLEQIGEASKEIEQLSYEYNLVTAYLKDTEAIEAMSTEERQELEESAKKIACIYEQRRSFQTRKTSSLTENRYQQMEQMEDDMPEQYEKLKKHEEYQTLVRQDLIKLDGERHAYQYRREETTAMIANIKGMTVILVSALAVCIFMLLILQFTFQMDATVGYLITAGAAAIALTLFYVRYTDAKKELHRIEKSNNKLILLQNKVKIRYVNNTNLLDYLYLKYKVKDANELRILWESYLMEREEREKYERSSSELEFSKEDLLRILRRHQINDPAIWLHQTRGLIEDREMVEIRHGLIVRRQKLRKQIEENKEMAKAVQEEVKNLVDQYPAYAKSILQVVAEYEKKYG